MVIVAVAIRPQAEHGARRREPFVDQDGIVRQRFDQPQRQHIRINRAARGLRPDLGDKRPAPGRPVGGCHACNIDFGALFQRAATSRFERRDQGAQRFPDVGLERDFGGIVLCKVMVDQPNLHDRQAAGQWIDLAEHRHPQRIGAEHNHQIVGSENLAHLLLDARQRAGETRTFREEVRAIGRGLLPRRRAEHQRQLRGLLQRIALHNFIARDDHRPLRLGNTARQR